MREIHGLQFFSLLFNFSLNFRFLTFSSHSFFLFMCASSSNTLPMLQCRSETSVLYFRYVLLVLGGFSYFLEENILLSTIFFSTLNLLSLPIKRFLRFDFPGLFFLAKDISLNFKKLSRRMRYLIYFLSRLNGWRKIPLILAETKTVLCPSTSNG